MDFAVLGDKNRDRILTAFRVPKTLLGIDLDVNRASADAMINVFQRNTIWPKLRSIQEKLNNELIPLFGTAQGLELSFDDPTAVS
jgi:capsid portal protein